MDKTLMSSLAGTVLGVGLIVGAARILGPIPLSISQTTTNKQSTFDVTGEGEITAVPDRAEINLGIQVSDSSVQKVQERGNQVINKINQDLLTMGIEKQDIKTINYNLYPNYDYRTGTQTITNYALNVNLQVKAKDFSKVTQIVDTATKDGANQIGGVTFTLSEDKRREVEKEVRVVAIKRAKEKAEELASLSGVRLGKIVNVIENTNGGGISPYPMMAKDVALEGRGGVGSAALPTNVEPGSTTFSMTVTLSYETL